MTTLTGSGRTRSFDGIGEGLHTLLPTQDVVFGDVGKGEIDAYVVDRIGQDVDGGGDARTLLEQCPQMPLDTGLREEATHPDLVVGIHREPLDLERQVHHRLFGEQRGVDAADQPSAAVEPRSGTRIGLDVELELGTAREPTVYLPLPSSTVPAAGPRRSGGGRCEIGAVASS